MPKTASSLVNIHSPHLSQVNRSSVLPGHIAKGWAAQMVLVVKKPPSNAGDSRDRFDPWVRKVPWRLSWHPTPVFLPGDSHGQRSRQATVHGVTKSWT